MATDKKAFTLRMQEATYEKARYLAFLDRRSVAMEIEHILLQHFATYEEEHGPIPISNPCESE